MNLLSVSSVSLCGSIYHRGTEDTEEEGKRRTDMSEMPIYVVAYDPSWVDKFESEKASLEQLLAPWRKGPIEHVGSTAVARSLRKTRDRHHGRRDVALGI